MESLTGELPVTDQGRSDIADAEHPHVPDSIDPENRSYLGSKLLHAVAQPTGAERTEER